MDEKEDEARFVVFIMLPGLLEVLGYGEGSNCSCLVQTKLQIDHDINQLAQLAVNKDQETGQQISHNMIRRIEPRDIQRWEKSY